MSKNRISSHDASLTRNLTLNRNPPRLLTSAATLLCALLIACQSPQSPPQVKTTVTPLPDTIERRIAELKLTLPPASKPSPTATLTSVVVSGNLAFVSGHISRAADGKLIMGRVGEELTVAQGKDAARQCGLAILASLRQELGTLDRVRRVVKVLGMVNCPPGFKDQPQVINGCSELFLDVFGRERGLGARSAVGVASLPSNVAVEVEAVFEIVP
ncbi:MAG: RidA family protein [Verrucomicrobia bacterium]|nr:RidA family protein [Verrucomicrobiota bacterium]